MKIRTFLFSIILCALCITTMGTYYAAISEEYSVSMDANTTATIAAFNQLASIRNITQEVNQTLFSTPSSEGGVSDLVGKFLGSGFNVLKVTLKSFDAFYTLAQNGFQALGLPSIFFDSILLIALIAFIFIVISVLVGVEV